MLDEFENELEDDKNSFSYTKILSKNKFNQILTWSIHTVIFIIISSFITLFIVDSYIDIDKKGKVLKSTDKKIQKERKNIKKQTNKLKSVSKTFKEMPDFYKNPPDLKKHAIEFMKENWSFITNYESFYKNTYSKLQLKFDEYDDLCYVKADILIPNEYYIKYLHNANKIFGKYYISIDDNELKFEKDGIKTTIKIFGFCDKTEEFLD